MQNPLIAFQYEEISVRVVMVLGEPWWVASDLAGLLGYRDASNMTRILPEKWLGTHIMSTNAGDRSMTIVSEPGMWFAIARSRKAEAQAIQEWMFGEVMPSIRRTGRYELPGADDIDAGEDEAGLDIDPPRLQAQVAAVREARRLFGPQVARAMWTQLGLPAPIANALPDYECDPLAEPLSRWLADKSGVTVSECLDALGMDRDADMRTRRRIGALLRLLGWHHRNVRRGPGTGGTVKLFTRLEA